MAGGLLGSAQINAGLLGGLLGQAQPRRPAAPLPAPVPQRERVSGWRLLDRVLGGQTVTEGLDAERTRLEAEAMRPQSLAYRQAALETITDPRERALFLGLGGEDWQKNVGEQFAPQVISAGGRQSVIGTGASVSAPSFSTVNDTIYQNDPATGRSVPTATAPAAYSDVTARYNAENPTVAANSRVVNLPSGQTVAEGYIAPDVSSVPEGGSLAVTGPDGRVINTVQGNPSTERRRSYEDSIGVRRFEDTGEPVFPDDFNRIRGQAETRLKAANQVADNLNESIAQALELSGGGETGVIGSLMGNVPGTRARQLRNVIQTIKSNIGFNYLQQMRELSPTGGALGNVAQQELAALQSVFGNLDPDMSEDQLDGTLRQIQGIVEQGRTLRQQAFQAQYGAAPATTAHGGGAAPAAGARLTPEQASQLPSGTRFVGLDGVERVKR